MIKKALIAAVSITALVSLYAGTATTTESKEKDCKTNCCPAQAKISSATATPTASPIKRSPRPADAEVYFISPKDGDVVGKEFKVVFGLKGMGVAPAGIDLPNTGHHHLLVNVEKLPDFNLPVPADENHKHYGKGQTETTLKLPPGKHTLQLLLGNYLHIPHDKEVISKKITVTVK